MRRLFVGISVVAVVTVVAVLLERQWMLEQVPTGPDGPGWLGRRPDHWLPLSRFLTMLNVGLLVVGAAVLATRARRGRGWWVPLAGTAAALTVQVTSLLTGPIRLRTSYALVPVGAHPPASYLWLVLGNLLTAGVAGWIVWRIPRLKRG